MTGLRLAALGELLDVRAESEAAIEPIAKAACIPFTELPERLHELPAKDETIRIAATGPETDAAQMFLETGGRKCEIIVDFTFNNDACERYRLWKSNDFLMSILPKLKTGRALDVGCGSGREAVALAGSGFSVVAADVLPDALDKGRDLARRYLIGTGDIKSPIEWLQRDLERDDPPEGTFDLIVSFRYLHRPLLRTIENLLNPGGSLVLETFTELHRERHGKPSSDDHVLKIGELPNLAPDLEVRIAEERWRGDSHTGRLWAAKL